MPGGTFRGVRASPSLDHLVGTSEHQWRDREAKQTRRPQIDDELELGRLFDGQLGWIRSLEYLVHIASCAAEEVDDVHAICRQSPRGNVFPKGVHGWQPVARRKFDDGGTVGIVANALCHQ